MNRLSDKSFLIAVAKVTALCAIGVAACALGSGESHRQPCRTAECKAVREFVKAHYCGESPFGNGPDDSCRIQSLEKKSPDVEIEADVHCNSYGGRCKQTGSVSSPLRTRMLDQMHKLGMPPKKDAEVLFSILKSKATGSLLLQSTYETSRGENEDVCLVVAVIDQQDRFHVLRGVPFRTTDIDGKALATWSDIDIAEINGRQEFILEGDEYENHWFEAFSIRGGAPKLDFAGLGYYL